MVVKLIRAIDSKSCIVEYLTPGWKDEKVGSQAVVPAKRLTPLPNRDFLKCHATKELCTWLKSFKNVELLESLIAGLKTSKGSLVREIIVEKKTLFRRNNKQQPPSIPSSSDPSSPNIADSKASKSEIDLKRSSLPSSDDSPDETKSESLTEEDETSFKPNTLTKIKEEAVKPEEKEKFESSEEKGSPIDVSSEALSFDLAWIGNKEQGEEPIAAEVIDGNVDLKNSGLNPASNGMLNASVGWEFN